MTLEVKNLKFGYTSSEELINGVTFSIEAGTCLGLLGESGSGKSTLAKLLVGFEKPQSGEIILNKKILFSNSITCEPRDRKISLVFQDFGLFPFLTARENIKLWMSSKEDINEELVKSLDLDLFLDKRVAQLSGGQKQRVGLARALASKPELLILDEPLSQLDEKTKSQFIEYFCGLKSRPTALWITHNPKIALQVSHALAYLNESGRLQGPLDAIEGNLSKLAPYLGALTL